MSAFDTAAMTGQIQAVGAMLNSSPDVDITSHGYGDDMSLAHTVIFMAVCGGQREVLVRLLAHADACGASHDQKRRSLFAGQLRGDARPEPAVCQAAALGYADVVEVILTAALSERGCRDSEGRSALHHACHNGHVPVANVVLAGCTVAASRELLFSDDDFGRNAFDIAAAAGYPDCLDLLLRAAALKGISLASAFSRVSPRLGIMGWTVFEHASARPPMTFGSGRSAGSVAAAKIECIDILLRHSDTSGVPFRRVISQHEYITSDEDEAGTSGPFGVGIGGDTAFALAAHPGHRGGEVLLHLLQMDQTVTPRRWDGDKDSQRMAMVGAMDVISRIPVGCEPDPVMDECVRHLLAGGGGCGVCLGSNERVHRIVREMAAFAITDRRVRSRPQ
jgi:hypothetical protein